MEILNFINILLFSYTFPKKHAIIFLAFGGKQNKMQKNIEKKIEEISEFNEIIEDIINNETVLKMKNFRQHFDTSCYEHCYMASYYCYKICKLFHLDYKSAARAGMLHDFFLYDWRKPNSSGGLHAFKHGKIAYENAKKLFELNDVEKDMIIKHMWPVTFFSFPKYPETLILTLVDKYCALEESIYDFFHNFSFKNSIKHAYLLLVFILFKKK